MTLGLVWVTAGAALTIIDYWVTPELLLGSAGGTKRTEMFGQIATTSVAVMAATLTVLSILVALPDRPRVKELRDTAGWRLLQGMLLATGGVSLAALISAELGIAFDDRTQPHQRWIEQWCFASVAAAALGTLVSGLAFALVLKAMAQPSDPSTDRGSG